MATELARRETDKTDLVAADREQAAGALQHILATGDLSKLSNEQRVAYYLDTCESLGLNPRSRPFDWLMLDGKLVLYPNKSCGEQLRRQHMISVRVMRREVVGEMFVVEVEGRTPNGRTDQSSKYVPLKDGRGQKLVGNNLANAFAKAETGAKRRLVLSMVGLASPPDPEEVQSAKYVVVDGAGRIIPNPTEQQRAIAADPGMARVLHEPTYEDSDPRTSPLAGTPDQKPTAEELEQPKSDGERATFGPDEETLKRWLGAWFAAVKGSSLDTDDARHRFVHGWTEGKTDSLETFLRHCTNRQAGDFLAHVRAIVKDEFDASGNDDGEPEQAAF